jgi:hypothetical protein
MNTTLYSATTTKAAPKPAPTTTVADALTDLLQIGVPPSKRPTKRHHKAVLIGGAVLAVGAAYAGSTILGIAPWAHADTFTGGEGDNSNTAFWQDIQRVGITGTVTQAGLLGPMICAAMANGESEAKAISIGMTNDGIDYTDAAYVVHSAQFHYCASDLN